MKTNQTFNQTFTLKNQKVMNNMKYSVSIKAMMAVVFAFVFSAFLNAQFEVPSPSTPGSQTSEDVRATSSVDYDITVLAGEQVRWAVIGGTITAGGAVTTDGDSSLIEWAGTSTITVNWDEDLSLLPIGSGVGQIIVQKRSSSACPSQLQILDITQWNNPTADLVDPVASICSGEAVGGNITINLTGAPDASADGFTVTYNLAAAGLTDLSGTALADATGSIVLSNTGTATIALPDGLINPTNAPIDYVVTLTAMTDDFTTPNGVLTSDGTYTITVNPVPTTGDINSSSSLTRR
jgi:hypothetical protein